MRNEDFGILGNGIPVFCVEFVFGFADFAKESALVVIDEGGVSPEEDVEYDAYGPHVGRFVVGDSVEDFWCNVSLKESCKNGCWLSCYNIDIK